MPPQAAPSETVHLRLKIALATLACLVAEWWACRFPDPTGMLPSVWPTSGLLAGALLLLPRRVWALMVGIVLALSFGTKLVIGRPWDLAGAFVLLEAAECVLCAHLMLRLQGPRVGFQRVAETATWVALSVGVTCVISMAAAGVAALLGDAAWVTVWKAWWVADGLGLLLMAPLVVTWGRRYGRTVAEIPHKADQRETVLFFCVWLGLGLLTFHDRLLHLPVRTHPYMLLVLLPWPAMRLGVRLTLTALLALALITLAAVLSPTGDIPPTANGVAGQLMWIQIFLGLGVVSGVLLAASVEESGVLLKSRLAEEERLRLLSDNLPHTMLYQLMIDPAGGRRFVFLSGNIQRLFGVTAAAALADPRVLYSQILPEYAPALQKAEDEATANLTDFDMTVRVRRADGRVVWMHLCSRPRLCPDGILWDGAATEVTEQQETLLALRESDELLRMAFHHSPIGKSLVSLAGRFLEVNPALCKLLGYSRDELQRLDFQAITHPEDMAGSVGYLRQLLAGEIKTFQMEKRYIHQDRRIIWVLLDVTLVRKPDGSPHYFVSQTQDITRRKVAERELLRAEEERRRMDSLF